MQFDEDDRLARWKAKCFDVFIQHVLLKDLCDSERGTVSV
jgi:hypothetical protein